MSGEADAVTVALTGQLAGVLLVAAPLALVVSLILLWIYRRAVRRSMMRHSGSVPPPDGAAAAPPAEPPPVPLEIAEAGAAAGQVPLSDALGRAALAARWRAAGVYAVAGLACASIMTSVFLGANGMEFLPIRFTVTALTYAWPIVLTVGVVATISRREWLAVVALYIAVLAAVASLAVNENVGWGQIALYWAIINGPPTVLVIGFLAPRIRAVGPMVLAFTIAAVGGATVNFNLVGTDPERIRRVVEVGWALGLDAVQIMWAMVLLGVLVLGMIGWLLLLLLGALYRARRVSDQSIIVDSTWFMFAISAGMEFVFAGPWWFLAALGAFSMFKLVALVGFALLRRFHAGDERPPRLLLLRVFSLGKRSEKLFDAFGKLWRYRGGIHMIAGPDLATSTVEPHEFLEFLTGRLARRFITGPRTFAQRRAEADDRRDFDGRYRVSDFFCHDDTWRMVLGDLARDSDAVLMDLRGFTPKHQGCIYEIQELLNAVPLDRVLFVIDATTDEPFLRATFAQCWAQTAADSPNRRMPTPRVRLFRLTGNSAGSVPALVREVAAAAGRYAGAPA